MAASRSTQKRVSAASASNARSAMIWGSLALCSILAVCGLIALRIGATGGSIVTARISDIPPPALPIIQKPQGASEFEVARLNDAIRALAAERDRLNTRVETLEQSVGDITASINSAKKPASSPAAPVEEKKQEEIARALETPAPPPAAPSPPSQAAAETPAPSSPPSAASAAITPASAPASGSRSPFFALTNPPVSDADKSADLLERPAVEKRSAARTSSVSRIERPGQVMKAATPKTLSPRRTRVSKTAPAAIIPLPPPAPLRPVAATSKNTQTQIAQILPGQTAGQAEVTGATKTEFGVDLGGETSLDGLRARWATLVGNHGPALEGLRPLVRVREGSRPGTVELHLIAGPVANAGTAARVCASLQSTGIACQAAEYDGQRLPAR